MAEQSCFSKCCLETTARLTTDLTSSQHRETLGLSLGLYAQHSVIKLQSMTICDRFLSSIAEGTLPSTTLSVMAAPESRSGCGSLSVIIYKIMSNWPAAGTTLGLSRHLLPSRPTQLTRHRLVTPGDHRSQLQEVPIGVTKPAPSRLADFQWP